MPLPLIAGLWAGFAAIAVPLAIKLLIGIGFASVTYIGVSALFDSITAQITANLSAAASSIVVILGLARVDDAIAVILSAMSAKLLLKGLTAAGAFSRLQFKGGA